MTRAEMKTVKVGDLLVHKYKLKPWKRLPSLVIDIKDHRMVTIMNPERGTIDISLDMWEFANEAR